MNRLHLALLTDNTGDDVWCGWKPDTNGRPEFFVYREPSTPTPGKSRTLDDSIDDANGVRLRPEELAGLLAVVGRGWPGPPEQVTATRNPQ